MIYMFLGTGFEETEAIAPLDLLRRAGLKVLTVGLNGKTVYGGHGIGVEADIEIDQLDLTDLEMVILPGGLGGVASIRGCEKAMEAIRFAYENGKYHRNPVEIRIQSIYKGCLINDLINEFGD